jgi:DNA topoisomerase-1
MPPKFKISRGGRGGRGGGFGGGRGRGGSTGGSWRGTSHPPYKDNTKGSTAGAGAGRTLIIVESPAKCQKIESYLGKDKYMCLASFGHIREIEDGLKSIDVDHEFKTKFAIMSSKHTQVSKLRAAIAAADEVILATDDDREGEAIAWHLCQVFNLSVDSTKRIIFHEITESALKAAIAAPRTIDMSLVHAQQARQILDLIVGYKISPVLWTYVAHTNLSAGRCQTPALRLIHDNYKEIEDANTGGGGATMVYSVSGIFTKLNLTFHLSRDLESTETLERFIKETAVAPDTAFRAKVGASKKVTKAPPRPYSTSTLQQAASNDLHLSPKDTMFVAQKLYEGGYITYMRTDSKVYSAEFVAKACGYIRGRWGSAGGASDGADNDLIGNISSVTGGGGCGGGAGSTEAAHEAIRPTDISRTLLPQSCHPREHRLYSIIHRNTLESIMAPAICQTITMAIPSPVAVEGDGGVAGGAEYRHTAEQVIKPGWKLVAGYEGDAREYTYFASLATSSTASVQQPTPYKKIMTKCSMRNTKSHYTESGLVQMLEKMGIGRPSTFSSLIDKIQERGYVKLQDVRGKSLECVEYTITEAVDVGGVGSIDASLNSPSKKGNRKIESKIEVREIGGETRKLVIQPLGIIVIEFLLEHFAPLFEYEFTKNMEFQLDEIATEGMVWHELCYKCWFDVTTQLQELKERGVVKEEVKIDDNHSYIIGKNGPVIRCRVTDAGDDVSDVSETIHSSDDDSMSDVSETIHEHEHEHEHSSAVKEKKPKFIFKPVRPDLDYAKILRGEYSLAYMIGEENLAGEATTVAASLSSASAVGGVGVSATEGGRVLGKHQGQDIIIKSGKYGAYVAWGGVNISLRPLLGISSSKAGKYARKETKQTKSEFDLTLQEVVAFINSSKQEIGTDGGGGEGAAATATTGIVRMIDEHTSIRNGRFGPYIFYKTMKMSKPDFIPLKGFAQLHGNYATCDISLLKAWVAQPRKK